MGTFLNKAALAAVIAVAPLAALADPVGLDGTLGAEWAGVSASHVVFDATAAIGNFGAPTNKSNNSSYDIYMRTDSQYLYVGLNQISAPVDASLMFANLYFAMVWGGGTSYSEIGFETGSDKAFHPQLVPGPFFSDTAANLMRTVTTANMIEVAIDLSVFTQNALGVTGFSGLPSGQTADGIVMTLSQSFGYSVAGGTAAYGANYLGAVAIPDAATVPEPASLALVGLALAGAAGAARRRSARA